MAHESGDAPRRVERLGCAFGQRLAEQLGPGGHGSGEPAGPALRRDRGLGLGVEEHGHQIDPRDAVDERVVGLREHGKALSTLVVLEPLHEPDLPQRLVEVERLSEHAPGQRPQLVLVAGLGKGGVADVVADVQVRVVDPAWSPLAQRHGDDPLAVARNEVQALVD
ncbi:MAG: hypothetical protein AVDCRST_MAG17-684 [uncultured Solirubrobacterales bacterium]|uniref:Uncharacterized protein n=1 Tax=uncultured Solirubrobacterales bacterium TaxID=768556 RepID=A0A6J4S4V6_9ACTN|nr:MAG: hypothetical protein AVDCRST_MAG17-684 [uncultured Solirubrobacterales bacterium]